MTPATTRGTPGPTVWATGTSGTVQVLVEAMTGYLDNDGANGDGFRVAPRGKVYGPYVEKDKIRVASQTPKKVNLDHLVYLDAFGNPILYYRSYLVPAGGGNPATVTFQTADNAAALAGPPDINAYVSGGATLRRTDYVLCTPGADAAWDASAGGDDCTNFSE